MTAVRPLSPIDLSRGKLIALAGVALFAVTILMTYLIWSGYREAIRTAETISRDYAAIIEARLDATLRRIDSDLQEVRLDIPLASLSKEAVPRYAAGLNARLDSRRPNFPELAGLRIYDADGDVLYTTDRETTPNVNIADRAFFAEVRESPPDSLVFSEMIIGRTTSRSHLILARALRDEQGGFRGIVNAAIELKYFEALFTSLDIGTRGVVAVYRRDSFNLIVHRPTGPGEVNKPLPPGSPARLAMASGQKRATAEATTVINGISYIFGFHALSSYPFFVSVGVAREDALAGWRARSLAVGLLGLLLILLLAGLLRRLWQAETRESRAVADLALGDANLRALSANASVGILVFLDRRFVFANELVARMLGYTVEELEGLLVSEIVHPDYRSLLFDRYLRRHAGEDIPSRYEAKMLAKDGRAIPVELNTSITSWNGQPANMTFVSDITERKRAESEIRDREERVRAIVETALDGIVTICAKGKVETFNPAASRIFGYDVAEVVGRNIKMLMPEPYRSEHDGYLENYLKTGDAKVIGIGREVTGRRKDGSTFPMELEISEMAVAGKRMFTGIVRDVTERKQAETERLAMEARLRRSQRLEAVGKLTGGMAHDFNNYLGIIIGNLDLLLDRDADDPVAMEWIEGALRGAESSAQLTRSLLAFSRQQPLAPRPVDVGQSLNTVATLLRRTLGEDIVLTVTVAPDVWPIRIDGSQLDSCIVNLANNARDAMPRGGPLTISAGNVEIDALEAEKYQDAVPGDYVLIEVSDAGAGMPPETVARAFEPFFSTKPVSHGTGLGLSMVYGFIKQSGGCVHIHSEVGHGTVVRLFLPRDRDAETAAVDASDSGPDPAAGGKETILIVEDNPVVRQTAVQQLASLGYRSIEAENGAEALAILERGEPRIDLLFTDMVMPGNIDGYELVQLARRTRPGIRVLLTSGFPGEAMNGRRPADVDLLAKPYRLGSLAKAIRGALDAESR